MAFLELERVSKRYNAAASDPVEALSEINFTVERGEWVSIMGPSGSGKTTLLHIIGCLEMSTTGAARIDSIDTSGLSRAEIARFRAERIGFIFQQVHLIPHLTALENVMLAQFFHSLADEGEAQRALALVGLGGRSNHLPSQLSGGEQRLVSIARAIANDPSIILADEPTGNLDAANEKIVLNLLADFQRQGRTLLVVTHSERVGRWSDRRIRLEHGRIVGPASTAEECRSVDRLLRALWPKGERRVPECDPTVRAGISQAGLMSAEEGVGALSFEGEAYARSIVRRRRLAERLFMDVLSIRDKLTTRSSDHELEYLLRPDITDQICALLGHPSTCPHGHPIPTGLCCQQVRNSQNSQVRNSLDASARSSGAPPSR